MGSLRRHKWAIDRAIAGADLCQSWSRAEFHRVKGNLLMLQGAKHFSPAEAQFQAAVDIARRQGALFWELRAAASLCRLLQKQDRADEGRAVLAAVYERFSEGFQTADMLEAQELLNSP